MYGFEAPFLSGFSWGITRNVQCTQYHYWLPFSLPEGGIRKLQILFGRDGLYWEEGHGDNWFTYFCKLKGIKEKAWLKEEIVTTTECCDRALYTENTMSRKQVHTLIRSHIEVKENVTSLVDEFQHGYFDGYFVIGVHYRGTDKHQEAPRKSYQEVVQAIEKEVSSYSGTKKVRIFVATDEAAFLSSVRSHFESREDKNRVVAAEVKRSLDKSKPIHMENSTPYQTGTLLAISMGFSGNLFFFYFFLCVIVCHCVGILGLMAWVDCFLLSRCDVLLRTSSNLGLFATFLNPDLKVTLLSSRYGHTYS